MSTRRGLLLVLILIVLVVAGAAVSARAQQRIVCQEGICAVPQHVLLELARQAELAQRYAFMCGWAKE